MAGLCRLALVAGMLLLAGIFLMIVYSVAMRYFANQPQPWIDEAAGWLLVGTVMLAIPEVQRRGEHIGIDLVTARAGPRWGRALLGLGILMVLATALVFALEGWTMVSFTRMVGILSNQLPEVPLWLVQGFVPLGFALMALVALTQLLLVVAGLKPKAMAEQVREEI